MGTSGMIRKMINLYAQRVELCGTKKNEMIWGTVQYEL